MPKTPKDINDENNPEKVFEGFDSIREEQKVIELHDMVAKLMAQAGLSFNPDLKEADVDMEVINYQLISGMNQDNKDDE